VAECIVRGVADSDDGQAVGAVVMVHSGADVADLTAAGVRVSRPGMGGRMTPARGGRGCGSGVFILV
jgi:hypothetical protein